MVLASICDVSIAKGQSSPQGVGEERVLAPICPVALVVRVVVVSVLLGVVFICGKRVRWRVDAGLRRVCVVRRQRKSCVLCRSGEQEVTPRLVFTHHRAYCSCVFMQSGGSVCNYYAIYFQTSCKLLINASSSSLARFRLILDFLNYTCRAGMTRMRAPSALHSCRRTRAAPGARRADSQMGPAPEPRLKGRPPSVTAAWRPDSSLPAPTERRRASSAGLRGKYKV